MERMTVSEASRKLNINEVGLRTLLQQGKLPIGYAIQKPHSSRFTYYIFTELVEGYIKRVEEGKL